MKITFAELQEKHFKLLHEWFHKPHVKKWYARDQDFTLAMITMKYTQRINNETIPNFIIYINDSPIGYIQFYLLTESLPDEVHDYNHSLFKLYNPSRLAGIDLFIAEEKYLYQGYASEVLQLFIQTYLSKKFDAIIVDPVIKNKHAIHFFEKNGFKTIESKNKHQLMVLKINN